MSGNALILIYASKCLTAFRGRVIKELGFRRSDIIVTTKIFWGVRPGPNAGGLSRKQYVLIPVSFNVSSYLIYA